MKKGEQVGRREENMSLVGKMTQAGQFVILIHGGTRADPLPISFASPQYALIFATTGPSGPMASKR